MLDIHIDILCQVHTQNRTQLNIVIHSINVKRWDFTTHLIQDLSNYLCKQTPSSPYLRKSTYKGK